MKRYFENIYGESISNLLIDIEKYINNEEKKFIITANPEIIIESQNDKELSKILLNKDNIIVPDGISIVKASKKYDKKIEERITGVDLSIKLLELANRYKKSLYLFGATDEVVRQLQANIHNKYPNISKVYIQNGYVKDKNKAFKDIISKNPDIVLVALGVPLQEKIISKNIAKFKKGIFIGVGGTFDVLSGAKKRAPKLFIQLNLEWLYRIVREPKRIKRFFKYNIKFLYLVNKEQRKKRKIH